MVILAAAVLGVLCFDSEWEGRRKNMNEVSVSALYFTHTGFLLVVGH